MRISRPLSTHRAADQRNGHRRLAFRSLAFKRSNYWSRCRTSSLAACAQPQGWLPVGCTPRHAYKSRRSMRSAYHCGNQRRSTEEMAGRCKRFRRAMLVFVPSRRGLVQRDGFGHDPAPDPDPILTALEQTGKDVFMRSCSSCHGSPLHPSQSVPTLASRRRKGAHHNI